jgi:hypothetical protein
MNNNYIGVDLDLFRQPKIQRLELKLGKGAVALYLQLCFKLSENEGKISLDDIPILSREFFSKEDTIKAVLEFPDLFIIKDNFFSCHWVSMRLELALHKSKKARQAVLKRWSNNKSNTDVIRTYNDSNTTKQNKTKENETKLNQTKKENTPTLNNFLNSPMYGSWKLTNFPNLTDEEIKVNVETYLTDYPEAKSTSINSFLRDVNRKKEKPKVKDDDSAYADIWQDDNETVEEFEERVKARQEMTGSRYKKHYTNSASNLVKI